MCIELVLTSLTKTYTTNLTPQNLLMKPYVSKSLLLKGELG